MIPTTWQEASDLLASARNRDNGKPVANNTRLYDRDNGTIALRLHDTDVVLFHSDGGKELHTGGWETVTTKQRINAALWSDFTVFSDKGRWYVSDRTDTVPFVDGMTVTPGAPLPMSENVLRQVIAEDDANDTMRRQVRAFVNGITADDIVRAFDNSGGDCLICRFALQDGTWGDDCLPTHLEERYFHATLFYRAVLDRRFGNPDFIMSWVYDKARNGHVDSDFFRKTLRRFLIRKLTVGAVQVA